MKLMQQNRNLVDRDENTMVRFEVGMELGAFKTNVESQYNTYKNTDYFLKTYLSDVIISLQDRLNVLAGILSNTSDLKIVEALEITDDIKLAYNDKKYIMTMGRYIDLMFAVSDTKDRLKALVDRYAELVNEFNKDYSERKDFAGYTYQMNERIYNLLQILRNQIEVEVIKLEKCE